MGIKNCLQKFSELLDPATPLKNVHDPQARVLHANVVNGLQELKVNPFATRICQVFSPNSGQLMTFEEFLDMLSSLSVATPPTVRAEWAFKIFDSDGDQLLGENDIRAWSMLSPGQTRLLTKVLTTRRATRWSGTSSRKPTSTELDRFPLLSSSKWWSGPQTSSTTSESGSKCPECQIANTYQII